MLIFQGVVPYCLHKIFPTIFPKYSCPLPHLVDLRLLRHMLLQRLLARPQRPNPSFLRNITKQKLAKFREKNNMWDNRRWEKVTIYTVQVEEAKGYAQGTWRCLHVRLLGFWNDACLTPCPSVSWKTLVIHPGRQGAVDPWWCGCAQ